MIATIEFKVDLIFEHSFVGAAAVLCLLTCFLCWCRFSAWSPGGDGAVVVYTLDAATDSGTYEVIPAPEAGSAFGFSVAISTSGSIFVGAPYASSKCY